MARARNIKPGFFTNDKLAEVAPLGRLLFAGLWTIADRVGRLEDRPKKIKAELLPYDECDAAELLNALSLHGFITRYVVDGIRYIQITKWDKHQNPHVKEAESTIPAPCFNGASPVNTGASPADCGLLVTDSLNRIPDSGLLGADSSSLADARVPATADAASVPKKRRAWVKPPAESSQVWEAYAEAYERRYRVAPVRSARVNANISTLIGEVGIDDAPAVAAFYVLHNKAFYLSQTHSTKWLAADAAGLRTQWANGRTVMAKDAHEADRVAADGGMWNRVGNRLRTEEIS